MSNFIIDKDGNKRWYNDKSLLHRLDGPAIEYLNGGKVWYINGLRHRIDGPAVECADGGEFWYIKDKLHRVDGPAVASDYTEWWFDGKRHRLDGPAVIYANGDKYWYFDGKLHRIDGPAVERADRTVEFWENGIQKFTRSIYDSFEASCEL